MTLTPSLMPSLETPAPEFELTATNGKVYSLHDFATADGLLVAFISHHCPYTKHVLDDFLTLAREYQAKGLAVVAINSNDPDQHDEDRPEQMAKVVEDMDFPFPYLIDDTQETAKAFQATCTPDFFLYGKERRLFYRGRFDDSSPDNDKPVTGDQLRGAVENVLGDFPPPETQKPSVGCNIKWKPGNEPKYFLELQKKYA